MPAIASAPFVLKDAVLTVDVDDYEKHVSSVTFTPAMSVVTWTPISPSGVFSDSTSPSWTCAVEYAQDWTTADSLSQYLMDNAGQTKTVIFKPLGATTGDPTFTATVIIAPGPIGGAVNTVQTGTVTMGVVGEPVRGTVA
ncbi:MAG TPA: hypothetical protein VIR15_07115 [Intrasporangium sp.]|uniref:hypothetical protein n=1 Tax=Intrasporangium sp. TaxID=1925024 RepID=UPI002F93C051